MRHLIITALSALIATGCAHTGTNATATTAEQKAVETSATTYTPHKNSHTSEIPGIDEVSTSRWGGKYTIFVSSQWRNPMVFEIVPNGKEEVKVRVLPSDVGSFAITAKTNPSRAIITYQGEDGARHRLCTMRGVEVYINLRTTGFGLDGVSCEFLKVFFRSDWENVAAQ